MSTDSKKHTSIAAGEKPTRAGLANAIFSINDVVPVANGTEANQVATAVVAAGQVLATNPLAVSRADARGIHRFEYTYDGTNWIPFSGLLTFASTAAAASYGTTYSSMLTTGDRCMISGVEYEWEAGWYPVGMRGLLNSATGTVVASATDTSLDVDDAGDLPTGVTWNEATKEVTISRAGRYRLMGSGRWPTNASGYRVLFFTKNGVLFAPGPSSVPGVAGVEIHQTCFAIGTFAAGDKFILRGNQNSGSSLTFLGAQITVERF